VPLRNAMNEVLRDRYIEDCQRGVDRWNVVLQRAGLDFRFRLPSRRFNRHVGIYAGHHFTPDGTSIDAAAWAAQRDAWLPSAADFAYVAALMQPVTERGKIAAWIAPPAKGIHGKPFDFEYVRL
jgi:benzoyl-CoA 2,3-dioxygenase component B